MYSELELETRLHTASPHVRESGIQQIFAVGSRNWNPESTMVWNPESTALVWNQESRRLESRIQMLGSII